MEAQKTLNFQQNFIYERKYANKELIISTDPKQYLGLLINGINQIQINEKFYPTVVELIKFFKFPILIMLKKPIEKILKDPQLTIQHQGELKKIAKIARDLIGSSGHIYELQFLFQKGMDHSFHFKQFTLSQPQKQFIQYIKTLSSQRKILYDKIKLKTITEDDIIYFQSIEPKFKMTSVEGNFENHIKYDIKQIESKYKEILKERNNSAKQKRQTEQKQLTFENKQSESDEQEQQAQMQKNAEKLRQKNTANKREEKQQNLEDIIVCCRRFFYFQQTIYQPQSTNVVYRYYPNLTDVKNNYEILKNVCGLLNADGGILLIGVKQDKNTYKKEVQGYTLIERQKQYIRNQMSDLIDVCIQPNISHEMLKILYVPVKNPQTNTFISGKYLIKICVRYGQRKQFYSFRESAQSKKEYFARRVDNDTKIIMSVQQILNIYKDRLLETPMIPKPIHPDPCPRPQNGKPLYERANN